MGWTSGMAVSAVAEISFMIFPHHIVRNGSPLPESPRVALSSRSLHSGSSPAVLAFVCQIMAWT
jgi:hypothetical protein